MRDENYYVVHGWMINQLDLKGTELVLYAIIFGFTQDGQSWFDGSIKYLQEGSGKGRTAVIENLKKLVDRQLLVKETNVINSVTFARYRAVYDPSVFRTPLVQKTNNPPSEKRTPPSTETEPYNTISKLKEESNTGDLFGNPKDQITTFRKSLANNQEVINNHFKNEIAAKIDVMHYVNSLIEWSDRQPIRTKSQQDKNLRTADGWLSTVSRAMREDKKRNKLVMIGQVVEDKSGDMMTFLNRD